MRKHLRTVLCSFVMSSLLCASASAVTFQDVPRSFWANKEISWAADRGLMNGTSSTTFTPNANILRGQMTAILYRYAGSPSVESASVYSDVTASDYYYNAAIWAVENEIMAGTRLTSKTMNAEEPISRAEFCTMLVNFSVYSDSYVPPSYSTSFTDTDHLDEITQWAIEWANNNGIVNGTSATTFNPHGTLTRSAAAAMLYRYENYAHSNPLIAAQARARELVQYYACPYPQLIEKMLVNTYSLSEDEAATAVSTAVSSDTWKPYAVAKAEEIYDIAPKQPGRQDVKNYLHSTLGFPSEICEYAVETADIQWNSPRTNVLYTWLSESDLESMGFTIHSGYTIIKLTYRATNQEYIITGLPLEFPKICSYTLDFNGLSVEGMYYSDRNALPKDCFYLSEESLIDTGILSSEGQVSSAVKRGASQEELRMLHETSGVLPFDCSLSSNCN